MTTGLAILSEIELMAFDFDGVFTDNTVYVSQNGTESVRCWRGDGLGISKVKEIGVKTCIISTEVNPIVRVRAEKLKIQCIQGVENKADAIFELCKETGVSPQKTLFIGNDVNDIPAFKCVGVAVGVADSCEMINAFVLFKTQRSGGKGAVREICDLVIAAKKNY